MDMQIQKFKKLKNGQYELITDEGNYTLHENLILKYNLLIKKELDFSLWEQIEQENQMYVIYNLSLKMLGRRIHSRKELYLSLTKKGYAKEAVIAALDLLEEQGYINDLQYAISYLHDRLLLSYDGPEKIEMQLLKNGVDQKIVREVMPDFSINLQKEKLTKLIQKEIKTNRTKSRNALFQKIVLHLIHLGYSRSLILSILDDFKIEDDETIRKKEYEKLYQKLSRKYEGKELELKIRQKMYQKGFTSYD